MADLAQTFHDLIRVETALWNAVDARLQDSCGLTLARFETMRVLQQFGPCRVLDIADHLTISWGAVSKIVDRVATAGHSASPQRCLRQSSINSADHWLTCARCDLAAILGLPEPDRDLRGVGAEGETCGVVGR